MLIIYENHPLVTDRQTEIRLSNICQIVTDRRMEIGLKSHLVLLVK